MKKSVEKEKKDDKKEVKKSELVATVKRCARNEMPLKPSVSFRSKKEYIRKPKHPGRREDDR